MIAQHCIFLGKVAGLVLGFVQRSVLLTLGIAIVLGMLLQPTGPETSAETDWSRRFDVRGIGYALDITMRDPQKTGLSFLILRDPSEKMVVRTGYDIHKKFITYSCLNGKLWAGLKTRADGVLSVVIDGPKIKTEIEFRQDGSSGMVVFDHGLRQAVLGQVDITAEGRPRAVPRGENESPAAAARGEANADSG